MNVDLSKKLNELKRGYLQKLKNVIFEFEECLDENKIDLSDLYSKVHSISGTCGIYGLNNLSDIATEFEFYLKKIKKKEVEDITKDKMLYKIFCKKFSAFIKKVEMILINNKTPKVVLADDEEFVRQFLATVLNSISYEVSAEVADGEELQPIMENLNPDMLILDINMPKLTGVEFLEQYAHKYPNTCIIILTSAKAQRVLDEIPKQYTQYFMRKDTPVKEMIKLIKKAWISFNQQ